MTFERYQMLTVGSWKVSTVGSRAVALPRVTEMIWIDLPVDECLRNIQARGIQGNGTEKAFRDLLKWVEDYSTRRDANSYAAHRHLFELFSGSKTRIKNRKDMAALLAKNG